MIRLFLVFGDIGLLILRVVLGLILIKHGSPKIKNLKKTAESFSGMGFKPGMFWGTLVAVVEVMGGIGLIAGFLTQVIALLVAVQFVVIILKLKRKAGFEKLEFDMLIFGAAAALAALGPGIYSVEGFFNLFLY